MKKWMKSLWKKASMSETERFLSQATDHADLEHRMERLRHEQSTRGMYYKNW